MRNMVPKRRSGAQVLRHAHLLAMAERIRLAVLPDGVAFPFRAFGENGQRVVAGVVLLIVDEQADQLLQIHFIFGDAAAHGSDVGGVQGGVAGIAVS